MAVSPATVSAAPIAGAPTTYCGDPDTDPSMDTGADTMITCDTQITNTVTAIDPGTGVASGTASVQVTECVGFAIGRTDPSALTCTTDIQNLTELVTNVEQCNGVGYGGGNVLECNVNVSTVFAAVTPQAVSAATVNQCNGSAPDTTGCNPFPATTTGATITQCNNSSYGGGQEDFNCLAAGQTSASLSVTVNQCNNSNYGGGSWLNCSAELSITSLPGPTPPPTPTPTASPATSPTAPPTSTPASTPTGGGSSTPTGNVTTPSSSPWVPNTAVSAVGTDSGPATGLAVALLALLTTSFVVLTAARRRQVRTQ